MAHRRHRWVSDLLELLRVADPDTQKNECHKYILGADYTD